MKSHIISSHSSICRTKNGETDICLKKDIIAFYNSDYLGGGNWCKEGTIENLICTFKNDITRYSQNILSDAITRLDKILTTDLKDILSFCHNNGLPSLRVCVVPRSKREEIYRPDQQYLRATVQNAVKRIPCLEDGTHDIIRHTDTCTTHLSRSGNGGNGEMPYIGITKDTCLISDEIIGKFVLLIDDLYTRTVNIDEDCIQALLDEGAKGVIFYSIGKTLPRF